MFATWLVLEAAVPQGCPGLRNPGPVFRPWSFEGEQSLWCGATAPGGAVPRQEQVPLEPLSSTARRPCPACPPPSWRPWFRAAHGSLLCHVQLLLAGSWASSSTVASRIATEGGAGSQPSLFLCRGSSLPLCPASERAGLESGREGQRTRLRPMTLQSGTRAPEGQTPRYLPVLHGALLGVPASPRTSRFTTP